MTRIAIWLASTVTVVVLLFGYHTSTNSPSAASTSSVAAPPSSGSGQAAPGTGSTGGTAASPSPSPSESTGSGTGTASAKTYTGSVAQTRWGPVQVAVTVSGGTITDVTVPEHPTDNPRDQEINDYALPVLVKATLQAQSADVDVVSGATVTSDGYLQSLQSALDQAGL